MMGKHLALCGAGILFMATRAVIAQDLPINYAGNLVFDNAERGFSPAGSMVVTENRILVRGTTNDEKATVLVDFRRDSETGAPELRAFVGDDEFASLFTDVAFTSNRFAPFVADSSFAFLPFSGEDPDCPQGQVFGCELSAVVVVGLDEGDLQVLSLFRMEDGVLDLQLSPDGELLYVVGLNSLVTYRVGPRGGLEEVSALPMGDGFDGVAVSADGRMLLGVQGFGGGFNEVVAIGIDPESGRSFSLATTVVEEDLRGVGSQTMAISTDGDELVMLLDSPLGGFRKDVARFQIGPDGAVSRAEINRQATDALSGSMRLASGLRLSTSGRLLFTNGVDADNVLVGDVINYLHAYDRVALGEPFDWVGALSSGDSGAYADDLAGMRDLALSPDDRFLYITSRSDGDREGGVGVRLAWFAVSNGSGTASTAANPSGGVTEPAANDPPAVGDVQEATASAGGCSILGAGSAATNDPLLILLSAMSALASAFRTLRRREHREYRLRGVVAAQSCAHPTWARRDASTWFRSGRAQVTEARSVRASERDDSAQIRLGFR